MKRYKDLSLIVVAVCLTATVLATAGETKFASGTSSATVTFDPATGPLTLKAYSVYSDKAGSYLKVYAASGVRKTASSAPTSTTVIPISNSDYGLTNSDTVVYSAYAGGSEYRTVNSATTTNVTLSSAITNTQGANDRIYEVAQIYQTEIGSNTTVRVAGEAIVITSADSPLYAVVDATSNAVVSATVDF